MSDSIVLVVEVNEVGSFDGKPRCWLSREREGIAKEGTTERETWLETVTELSLSHEQARWFGRRLYRKIRVTFEDIGPLDDDKREVTP